MQSDTQISQARRAVLDHLKRFGPAQAAALADALGVTPMAIRQHLYALEEAGLVEFVDTQKSGGRGRPSKQWQLRTQADSYFNDTHAELSVELIANIREVFGERGLDKLIAKRTEQQVSAYRHALAGAATLKEKVKRLAKLRHEAGYLAEYAATNDGYLLVENHCPICRAARACSGLCRQELDVFQLALGKDVEVARTDHILAGARRCAYHIRQK